MLCLWRRLSPRQGAHRNGGRSASGRTAPAADAHTSEGQASEQTRVVPEAPGATRSHSLVIARSKGVATAALKASLIETKQHRGARAVVFPSLYEGFGLPVLEAMTLGTPVVTSHESSLPEIAGDAAVLVDPYDAGDIAHAITAIVNDVDLRAELSRRGRLQAAKFSLARYRERVEALYASLR